MGIMRVAHAAETGYESEGVRCGGSVTNRTLLSRRRPLLTGHHAPGSSTALWLSLHPAIRVAGAASGPWGGSDFKKDTEPVRNTLPYALDSVARIAPRP